MTRQARMIGKTLVLLACTWQCPAAEPVELTDKRQLRLAATVSDLCVGGSGRYLVLYFADQRLLSVLDLKHEQTAFNVRPIEQRFLFTANRDSLYLIHIESRLMQRWNLATGRRQSEDLFPIDGALKAVAMGAASSGPLIILHGDGIRPLDDAHYSLVHPQTLQVKRIEQSMRDRKYRDQVHIRAAGNGQLFGLWATSHTPSGLSTVWIRGSKITTHRIHDSAGHLAPGGNGQFIFTGAGVYTADLQSAPHEGVTERTFCVPAVTGDLFVVAGNGMLSIRGGNSLVALVSDSNYFRSEQQQTGIRSDMTNDKRIILAPGVAKLAVVPRDTQTIEIYDFDAELVAANVVLRVLSEPPIQVTRGSRLEYRVKTTVSGELKYKIEGPGGMRVSQSGVVTWQVPASYHKSFPRVLLTITDAQGNSVRHGFVIRVSGD